MSGHVDERRRMPRRRAEARDGLRARMRPGGDVGIVDLSAGGVLVDTERPLFPGAAVQLQIEGSGRVLAIRGRVLRCAIVQLRPSSICYRGAIRFDHHLPWFIEKAHCEYQVPAADLPAIETTCVNPTHCRR
jgi:hypothetical protein